MAALERATSSKRSLGRGVVAFVMVLALMVPLLTACDDDDDETPTIAMTTEQTQTTEPPPTEPVSTEPVKIGVVTAWSGSSAMVGIFADWWEEVVEQQVEDMGGILGGRSVEFVNYDG